MTSNDDATWLRPELRDREVELITFTEFAHLAGVDRGTAYGWMRANPGTFPQTVKEVPAGNGPIRYFLPSEAVRWLLRHRPRLREPERERSRLRVLLASLNEEISLDEQAIRHKVSLSEQITAALEG